MTYSSRRAGSSATATYEQERKTLSKKTYFTKLRTRNALVSLYSYSYPAVASYTQSFRRTHGSVGVTIRRQ